LGCWKTQATSDACWLSRRGKAKWFVPGKIFSHRPIKSFVVCSSSGNQAGQRFVTALFLNRNPLCAKISLTLEIWGCLQQRRLAVLKNDSLEDFFLAQKQHRRTGT
jgi:hypothetical protein